VDQKGVMYGTFARLQFDREGFDRGRIEIHVLAARQHVGAVNVGLLNVQQSEFLRSGHKLHATVLDRRGGDRHPGGQHLAGIVTKIGIVLMPADIGPIAAALEPDGIVIEHDIGADQILYRIQQSGLGSHFVDPGEAQIELGLPNGQVADYDVSHTDPVTMSLEPGEASIHHAYTIHGSLPNLSDRRRMGITFMYMPAHIGQKGERRTTAMLVRGEDRYGNFDPEIPPSRDDDPDAIERHKLSASMYRGKEEELGKKTAARFD